MDELRQRVRAFVLQNFYVPAGDALPDDASLLEHGVVDSTGILEIITFLEQRFGLRIEDQEITPQNLDSIARIADFVARKRSP